MGELPTEGIIFYIIIGILVALFFTKSGLTPIKIEPVFQEPAVSEQIDAHGCNNSQGFFWCEYQQRCIHPPQELCQPISPIP